MTTNYTVKLKRPHAKQLEFIDSSAKRKVIRAGRRGGKTTGIAIYAVQLFLQGKRVLYATPTSDQIEKFWFEIKIALEELLDAGIFKKNETRHTVELEGTSQRIRAKTAWNADTLRGDYADVLILDEWQLMNEEAWERVGAPMLADNNGDAVFIYTPPSLQSRSTSKARDPRHAAKLFKHAMADETGRWQAFHFTSYDNPHISRIALDELAGDMSTLSYQQEIMAEDLDHVPGALWNRDILDANRVDTLPDLKRVIVAIDPAMSANEMSNETGIVVAGIGYDDAGYVLSDVSGVYSPDQWARRATNAYEDFQADRIIGEVNNGGDLIEHTIRTMNGRVSYKAVRATRGKITRAEPIAALYERHRIKHYGYFPELEDQLCTWTPGNDSPDRLDALVWAFTELMLGKSSTVEPNKNPFFD